MAAYVVNEKGEFLACYRKDGKSWQTVQGGVEGDDDDLQQAAMRELEEEVGLTAEHGLAYVGEIFPPSVSELRQFRGPSTTSSNDRNCSSNDTTSESDKLPDWTFFRYELPWYAGKRIREQGYIGQEQRQLIYYMPSEGIRHAQLRPDPAKFGPDVKQEFRRVSWMDMGQFFALVASHKSHIFAYLFYKSRDLISAFLSTRPATQATPQVKAVSTTTEGVLNDERATLDATAPQIE